MSHNNFDKDTSESEQHHWNQREEKKPLKWYALLIVICSGISWILSSMGHE